jgi:integrase
LCTFLFTSELIAANPMPLVGRPKIAKTLPKALPTGSVTALLAALNEDPQPRRRSDWIERDRALILTALLAGLRADELLRANVGDLRRSDEGAVIPCSRQGWEGPSGSDRSVAGRGPRGLSRQSRGPVPGHGQEALLPRRGIGLLVADGAVVCGC